MRERVASFTLLVPGPWTDASPVLGALHRAGIMAQAYAPGRSVTRGDIVVEIIAMERSRGYADIDPHHAWAQWQVAAR